VGNLSQSFKAESVMDTDSGDSVHLAGGATRTSPEASKSPNPMSI
jgi:hypothetical protein